MCNVFVIVIKDCSCNYNHFCNWLKSNWPMCVMRIEHAFSSYLWSISSNSSVSGIDSMWTVGKINKLQASCQICHLPDVQLHYCQICSFWWRNVNTIKICLRNSPMLGLFSIYAAFLCQKYWPNRRNLMLSKYSVRCTLWWQYYDAYTLQLYLLLITNSMPISLTLPRPVINHAALYTLWSLAFLFTRSSRQRVPSQLRESGRFPVQGKLGREKVPNLRDKRFHVHD